MLDLYERKKIMDTGGRSQLVKIVLYNFLEAEEKAEKKRPKKEKKTRAPT